MTNDIARIHNDPLAALGGLDTLEAQLEASAESVQSHTEEAFFGNFISFAATVPIVKLSPWSYGDGEEIHPDSKWVVDATSFEHGWQGWKPGPGGTPVKGLKPDKLFSTWNEPVPTPPADKPWMGKAYQFDVQCVESPIEGQEGTFGKVADWRKMSKGFASLEKAIRDRVLRALKLRGEGKMEEANELLARIHPVIQFKFEMNVKIPGRGTFNRAIIHQLPGEAGWAGVRPEGEQAEAPGRTQREE